MDFDIPVGRNGDNYDRQVIRMEEMRQSTFIMQQCVKKLLAPEGQGPVATRPGQGGALRRGAEMKRSMEALIHHFKLYTEGFPRSGRRSLCGGRGAQRRVRRLSRERRHRQALSLQDPRAGLRPSSGHGFHVSGTYAGRRLGHPWLARYRVSARSIADAPGRDRPFWPSSLRLPSRGADASTVGQLLKGRLRDQDGRFRMGPAVPISFCRREVALTCATAVLGRPVKKLN